MLVKTLHHNKKLILTPLLLLLMGLGASTITAYLHVSSWLKTAVKDEQLTLASTAQTSLEQWISTNKQAVLTFSEQVAKFDGAIENNPVFDLLIEQYTQSEQFEYLSISLEETGYYRVNSWAIPKGYDPRTRPWYQAAKQNRKVSIIWPYAGVDEPKKYYLSISAPIVRGDKFIGVVSGDISQQYLESLIEKQGIGFFQSSFLVNSQGDVIVHSEHGLIGQHLSELAHFKEAIPDSLSAIANQGQVYLAKNHMFAVVPLPSLGLNLVLQFSIDDLNQRLLTETVTLLAHFLIIFILVVLAFFLVGRKIVKPVFDFLLLDNQTALPDKKNFKSLVEHRFLDANVAGLLVIINLDYFNELTSSYPSSVIRTLLNQVKGRIQDQIGSKALLGVFSESRFLAFVPSEKKGADNEEGILAAIKDSLDRPFIIAEREINLSSHIGACAFPKLGHDIEELINHAFTAFFRFPSLWDSGLPSVFQ